MFSVVNVHMNYKTNNKLYLIPDVQNDPVSVIVK